MHFSPSDLPVELYQYGTSAKNRINNTCENAWNKDCGNGMCSTTFLVMSEQSEPRHLVSTSN